MNGSSFCTNCGTAITPGAANCSNCGSPVAGPSPAPEPSAPVAATDPPPAQPGPEAAAPTPQPWGGPREPGLVSEYMRGLIDFRFHEIFTPKMVGLTYAGLFIFNAVILLAVLVGAFATKNAAVIIISLLVIPPYLIVATATWKLCFEFYMVALRILGQSELHTDLLKKLADKEAE